MGTKQGRPFCMTSRSPLTFAPRTLISIDLGIVSDRDPLFIAMTRHVDHVVIVLRSAGDRLLKMSLIECVKQVRLNAKQPRQGVGYVAV